MTDNAARLQAIKNENPCGRARHVGANESSKGDRSKVGADSRPTRVKREVPFSLSGCLHTGPSSVKKVA